MSELCCFLIFPSELCCQLECSVSWIPFFQSFMKFWIGLNLESGPWGPSEFLLPWQWILHNCSACDVWAVAHMYPLQYGRICFFCFTLTITDTLFSAKRDPGPTTLFSPYVLLADNHTSSVPVICVVMKLSVSIQFSSDISIVNCSQIDGLLVWGVSKIQGLWVSFSSLAWHTSIHIHRLFISLEIWCDNCPEGYSLLSLD